MEKFFRLCPMPASWAELCCLPAACNWGSLFIVVIFSLLNWSEVFIFIFSHKTFPRKILHGTPVKYQQSKTALRSWEKGKCRQNLSRHSSPSPVHTCLHTVTSSFTHLHTHNYLLTFMHTCICTLLFNHTYTYTITCTSSCIQIHSYAHTLFAHIYMHTYTHDPEAVLQNLVDLWNTVWKSLLWVTDSIFSPLSYWTAFPDLNSWLSIHLQRIKCLFLKNN